MRLLSRSVFLLIVCILLAGSVDRAPGIQTSPNGDDVLAKAYRDRVSGIQVEADGTVVTILPDDTNGKRHQRFILRMRSGQTLLIAHNIEIAPRIPSLQIKDAVRFLGEYEWNAKGGLVHWTHRDPAGKHKEGWLKYKGKVYR